MRSAFIRNREISLLDKLWHRNIVNLLDIIYLEEEQEDSFLLVLDWAPTALDSLLDALKIPFSPTQFKAVAWQLIEGIAYIHENGIIHRDISPNNVLITQKGIVKLSDFGSATLVSPNRKYDPNATISSNTNSIVVQNNNIGSAINSNIANNHPIATSSSGGSMGYLEEELTPNVCTLWYRAPEILTEKDYGYEVDCWSYGCLLMEMATGEPVFPGDSEMRQLNLIDSFFNNLSVVKSENSNKRLRLIDVRDPAPFSQSAVQKYLEKFKTAITANGDTTKATNNNCLPIITDHNFIALIEGLLTYNPSNRLLAKDVIQHGFFYKLPYPCSNLEILSGIGP